MPGDFLQITYQNPHAERPMFIPYLVMPNTHEEQVDANIRANSQLDVPWLARRDAHDRVAVICGGGPSLVDDIDTIKAMANRGATVFGLNGASVLLSRDVAVDYQVIIDAQEITSALVDLDANRRLFASHVHPETAASADEFFHLNFDGVEDLLPPAKVEEGGYTLVGGGVSVGITALVAAFVLGYRKMHLFGYDSSNRAGATHAYKQWWNEGIPQIDVTWGYRQFRASMPMKLQAEAFPRFAAQLIEEGCELTVHGDGLLPAIWNEPPADERQKYQLMWMNPNYGRKSPGEESAETFAEVVKPDGLVADFGCGTGRGAKAINDITGCDVLLVDFTDNCRDKDLMHLRFLQWDLTKPMPFRAPYGYCADVMEHIPTDDVPAVIANIMAAAERVFFQISTIPDQFGATIGQRLHLTVRSHGWWAERFAGYRIEWQEETDIYSSFYIKRA
jgi:SAM-dependent methyltransferase